jgi:hypothetical protein
LHSVPLGTGQLEKDGAPTPCVDGTLVVTVTPVLSALALQTQMTNCAVRPALICDEDENDCTSAQSWGDLVPEVGELLGLGLLDLLGLGLGLEDLLGLGLEVGLGDEVLGDGLGVDESDGESAGDELSGAVEVESLGAGDVPESVGLGLSDELSDGDRLGACDADELLELTGADSMGEAEALPDTTLPACEALLIIAAVSSALAGSVEHADAAAELVALATGALVAANASLAMPMPKNANPVSAPSAAGLRIRALTCEPRFSSIPGQAATQPPCSSHYAWLT